MIVVILNVEWFDFLLKNKIVIDKVCCLLCFSFLEVYMICKILSYLLIDIYNVVFYKLFRW